jgi:ABC-type glycerol-3-phosphate transport system permease component
MSDTLPTVAGLELERELVQRPNDDKLRRSGDNGPLRPKRRTRRSRTDNPMRGIVTGKADRFTIYALLIVLAVLFAFPLYSAIVKSLEINGIQNYISLFTNPVGDIPIWQTYLNSLAVGAVHAAIVLTVSVTAGYAFSKLQFRGRELSFSAVLLFLAVPGIAILVPVYRITQELGLFNTYLGVGLPEAAITIPFGVLLMRNYGGNISDSLIEAANLDGAGHFRVFWNVFVPLCRPAIINLMVLCFIWSLQDFLWPAFLFTDPKLTTAAQAVSTFSSALGRGAGDLARFNASLVVLAVPAVLFVIFGLRFIVNGLTTGSVKD